MSARQRRRREQRRQQHSGSNPTRRRLLAAGGLTAGATLAMAGPAHAAPLTYTVGTSADASTGGACTTPTNADCSLREAVTLANANTGADTIVFNSNLTGSTIHLNTGGLPITEALSINGPGASQLTVDAGGNSRIFPINLSTADDPVSISGLTLANGYVSSGSGGAIDNVNSSLTIAGSVVRDSYAKGLKVAGGGVYTQNGSLAINNSTVSGNGSYYGGGVGGKYGNVTITGSTLTANTAYGDTASSYNNGYGGAIWMGQADVTIRDSTLDHNTATDGGGVYASDRVGSGGGATTVINSTIAQNHARDDGGALWGFGSSASQALSVTGSTIVGNSAVNYAGALDFGSLSANPVLQDSIITGNTVSGVTSKPDSADLYIQGTTYHFDTSFSLIGVPGPYAVQAVPGSVLVGVNPQLGSLANNGGPTRTMLPASTSPVVDKGKSFGLNTDQRGLTRPVEFPGVANSAAAGADGADMGAVELQVTTAGPTGQRAAALNKCKRKHKNALKNKRKHDALTKPVKKNLNKKFKKCKRKANQLPV
jgi:hypothetical protein